MSSSARIEELRKKFDENPRRYFAPLANEYRKAGDFDQAIFICQEYLPQQPGHMSGHIVFGQALFEAKRLPEAKTVFETALSLDPENLIALRHLADISRDLGDTAAARTWYERVLHADPRNEEIAAIMETLGSAKSAEAPGAPKAGSSPVAPTAEVPAVSASPKPVDASVDPSKAPTVVLSAAAIQEMMKARQAAKAPAPKPAEPAKPVNLDSVSTIEIRAEGADSGTLEGLEPTSHAAPLDMPAFEPLGLEPTSLGLEPTSLGVEPTSLGLESNSTPTIEQEEAAPAPLDGLDTISLDLTMGGDASAMTPTIDMPAIKPPAPPEPAAADDGLLDLGSFSFGGGASAPAAATPTASETPIDGGHDAGMELLDLDLPSAPEPAPAKIEDVSIPTMVIEAIKSVAPVVQETLGATVPVVMDALESAAPAMMDLVDTTVPSVIETVQSVAPAVVEAVAETPTVIMQAIRPPAETPETEQAPSTTEKRPSQTVPFVTETMAQLYLSQGHRDEAIDIYKKLIEARPDDAQLRSRLAEIENQVTPAPPRADAASGPAPVKRFAGTGPSIRTVLRDLFGVDGSATLPSPSDFAGAPGEVGSIDLLFSSNSVADAMSPLAVAFDGGFVASTGNIDELFAGGGQ